MTRMLTAIAVLAAAACSSQKPAPAEPTGVASAKIYSCFTFAGCAHAGGVRRSPGR